MNEGIADDPTFLDSDSASLMSTSIEVSNEDQLRRFVGPNTTYLRDLGRSFSLEVGLRGLCIDAKGTVEDVTLFRRFVHQTLALMATGRKFSREELLRAAKELKHNQDGDLRSLFSQVVLRPTKKKAITPKSFTQRAYVRAMDEHDVVFGVGPAGTGKTYLAVAMAVAALDAGHVGRIILTRPAVEAGERLGFLPGDLAEKVDPYLRPLFDALSDMMEGSDVRDRLADGTIEIAPLAYMRGRTLSNAFVILDEAQNTTVPQMKMFLTRLGYSSRTVITGDISQTDLPTGKQSGLADAARRLRDVSGLAFVEFRASDVVRHPLVERIIRAYEGAAN